MLLCLEYKPLHKILPLVWITALPQFTAHITKLTSPISYNVLNDKTWWKWFSCSLPQRDLSFQVFQQRKAFLFSSIFLLTHMAPFPLGTPAMRCFLEHPNLIFNWLGDPQPSNSPLLTVLFKSCFLLPPSFHFSWWRATHAEEVRHLLPTWRALRWSGFWMGKTLHDG